MNLDLSAEAEDVVRRAASVAAVMQMDVSSVEEAMWRTAEWNREVGALVKVFRDCGIKIGNQNLALKRARARRRGPD